MRSIGLLLFAACVFTFCRAQDNKGLAAYLQTHRYAISLSDTNAFAMLPRLMGTRNVLVHGEGASHILKLYDSLQLAIRRQLVRQELRVALIEYGHDVAYLFTKYLDGDSTLATMFQSSALIPYKPFRGKASFRVAGIDFERAETFHLAVVTELRGFDKSRLSATADFIEMISGNSYQDYSEKEFNSFYKKVSASWTSLDDALREEIGINYETLKYLCTNANTSRRYENRNPALAANFVREITPFDSAATFYCEIGKGHARLNDRGSMAAILSKSELLKDRLIVMNTFCEGCFTDKGIISDNLSFMKGDRLKVFREASMGSITLFDLSELNGSEREMKESGSLVLFVRDHD